LIGSTKRIMQSDIGKLATAAAAIKHLAALVWQPEKAFQLKLTAFSLAGRRLNNCTHLVSMRTEMQNEEHNAANDQWLRSKAPGVKFFWPGMRCGLPGCFPGCSVVIAGLAMMPFAGAG
jgi:hypothetical protein